MDKLFFKVLEFLITILYPLIAGTIVAVCVGREVGPNLGVAAGGAVFFILVPIERMRVKMEDK